MLKVFKIPKAYPRIAIPWDDENFLFCLFQNRDFMDSYDQFADDDEIKESNNPLYCSRSEMQ